MCRSINDNKLTSRQREMMYYLAWGFSHKEIAEQLGVTISTVANTLRALYSKLGLNKDTEIAAYYFCSKYNVSTPEQVGKRIKKALGAISLLLLVTIQVATADGTDILKARLSRSRRSRHDEIELLNFNIE